MSNFRDIDTIVKTAYYTYHGYRQNVISEMIGKNVSTINRCLAEAQNLGWLKIDRKLFIPEEFKFYIPNRDLDTERKINNRYGNLLEEVRVIIPISSRVDTNNTNHDQIYNDLGVYKEVARYFESIIFSRFNTSSMHNILVSWGLNIMKAIDEITLSVPNSLVNIFPVSGDFPLASMIKVKDINETTPYIKKLLNEYTSNSSNQNARKLAQKLILTINPIPITTPAILTINDDSPYNFNPFLESDYTYNKLYGPFNEEIEPNERECFACKIDSFLTSIGDNKTLPENSHSISGDNFKSIYNSEDIDFAGNISGALFNSKGGSVEIKGRKSFGIKMNIIKSIAERHRELLAKNNNTGAGVVVFTSGKKKVNSLKILIENNMINRLITDVSTANELLVP